MTAGGLLIVNADDWGIDRQTTEAILKCFADGGVSSASGMVFMADSRRAAQLAVDGGLPVGLHINLTVPFTDPAAAEPVRRRQAQIVAYFGGPSWRRWGASPALFAAIERSIADQLAEFRALYGGEPSHLDGHQHIHQSLGVLAARTMPTGARMRPSFTFFAGEKSRLNRSVRAVVNGVMRARFAVPSYFFSLRDMHPALGGDGLEEKLALSSGSAVEVMTHPACDDELPILLDPAWLELIGQRNLGDYTQLERRQGWGSRASATYDRREITDRPR